MIDYNEGKHVNNKDVLILLDFASSMAGSIERCKKVI